MWGDVTSTEERTRSQGDMGRYREIWGDTGRCREMWGDVTSAEERTQSTSRVPSAPAAGLKKSSRLAWLGLGVRGRGRVTARVTVRVEEVVAAHLGRVRG